MKVDRKESHSPLQQWGVWLANELIKFGDKIERLKMQNYITSYIIRKRRESNL